MYEVQRMVKEGYAFVGYYMACELESVVDDDCIVERAISCEEEFVLVIKSCPIGYTGTYVILYRNFP